MHTHLHAMQLTSLALKQLDRTDDNSASDDRDLERDLRDTFETSISRRVQRASSIQYLPVQPYHWFSAAAADCAGMYVSSFFYGAISVAQAYVEALSMFLGNHHRIRIVRDVELRWSRLLDKGCTSSEQCELLGSKTKRHISCFQGLADASTEASFA